VPKTKSINLWLVISDGRCIWLNLVALEMEMEMEMER
jgi:hypothetical protein